MTRRLLKLALALVVLLLLAGHVAYWYWPRERAGVPAPADLPARLLAAGPFDACFWIPYPHQNLGALAAAVQDWPAFLGAAARLAELPPPSLPSFGPFAVPPSHEATVCSDVEGGRLVVAARVYPALAVVARASGRLAGNPWLAGGDIEDLERPAHVEWQGDLWTVAMAGASAEVDPGLVPPVPPPSLAAVRLDRRLSRFPAGTYLLQRQGADLELALAGAAEVSRPEPDFEAAARPALLAATESAELSGTAAPTALALFDHAPRALERLGLPGLAVFSLPGEARWELPAEGLLNLLSGALRKGNAAGWRIVALDAESLSRAEALAPGLGAVVGPDPPGDLLLGLWLEPAAARALVSRLWQQLEKVPLVERRQVRRLRDWETLLTPLSRCQSVSLVALESPDAFRLRLAGCR